MEKDLKRIKKSYGEQMMHLCRELFPKILETEGLLPYLLKEHFPINSHFLAEDIKENNKTNDFKNYIFSLIDVENNSQIIETKSAVELMSDAGYILYPECKTEKDIQSFKKWWRPSEKLCTFKGGRLNSCRVWFAVKKNAEDIKREDFTNPTRQDEYGTSVISIQFSRGDGQCLSIKNRYNHSVNNPDNTFNSDLDNIIPGLADAFERDYGARDKFGRSKSNFELNNYICVNGKFYHYNHEIGNVYYCDGGVIIDNFEVKRLPPHQMLMDYFVVDFNKKTISIIYENIQDSFCDSIGEIKQMSFSNGILRILTEDDNEIEIGVSPRNEIISYKNKNLQIMHRKFLMYNKNLRVLDTQNLKHMGYMCLFDNKAMTELILPQLERMDCSCFSWNKSIIKLSLPKLETMNKRCFYHNKELTKLILPKLQKMYEGCFQENMIMTELHLPELKTMGGRCFYSNEAMLEINLPELISMGEWCFFKNVVMRKLNLPKLQKMDAGCFYYNTELTELMLPELKTMETSCFQKNMAMSELNLPKLQKMYEGCFQDNMTMTELHLPELKTMRSFCFQKNKVMSKLDLPELQIMGEGCFEKTKTVEELNLPKLESMGKNCFGLDKSQVNGHLLSEMKKNAIISKITKGKENEQTK